MYCQGFGDCFLVTFVYDSDPEKVHMLFDFGVWKQTAISLESIAADILKTTGGKLDVLVITHEHKDHLSGFYKKMREAFYARHDDTAADKLRFDRLWLAWTEDYENNPLAKELRQLYQKAHKALTDTNQKLQGLSGMDDIRKLQEELLELEDGGLEETDEPEASGQAELGADETPNEATETPKKRRIPSNVAALDWLKKNARIVKYFKPGQRVNSIKEAMPEGLEGVQFFVLGPPEQLSHLKKNESAKSGDLYLNETFIANDFSMGAVKMDGQFDNYFSWIDQTPFEDEYCCPARFEMDQQPDLRPAKDEGDPGWRTKQLTDRMARLQECEVYQNYFGLHKNPDSQQKLSPKRRIDYDWLRVSQSLALDLNSHTNNTSLVLAIEIDSTKQVLLFPGDAQFGNWNSWFENNYQWQFDKKENEPKRTVTVEDLLERTIFYKVSHHGSHNATPQDRGLKLMTRTDLVAMVPVSRETAKGNDWPIPYDKLTKAFDERPVTYVYSDSPGETRGNKDAKVFKAAENGLYVDYEISL